MTGSKPGFQAILTSGKNNGVVGIFSIAWKWAVKSLSCQLKWLAAAAHQYEKSKWIDLIINFHGYI